MSVWLRSRTTGGLWMHAPLFMGDQMLTVLLPKRLGLLVSSLRDAPPGRDCGAF